jgi:endonuclease-3
LESLIDALRQFYGTLPSPPRDPFGLFVWEILSIRSTPRRRDAAFGALRRVPALTPDSMSRAPQKKLEDSVALAGPYAEQRLRALRSGVDVFRRMPDLPRLIRGRLPAARRGVAALPQLGEGGAHRMLLFAADHMILPIDPSVARVACRLGYGDRHVRFSRVARSTRKKLVRELRCEAGALREAFLYLSNHGAATCTEKDPHCGVCPLLVECPYGGRRLDQLSDATRR